MSDPWYFFEIPDPPDDAPYRQVMDHAAVAALITSARPMMSERGLPQGVIRVMRAYMQHWYPNVELPE